MGRLNECEMCGHYDWVHSGGICSLNYCQCGKKSATATESKPEHAPVPSEVKLSTRIRTLRGFLLLTQSEFGKLIGASRQQVSRMESGRAVPNSATRRRFEALEDRYLITQK
jgi:DNA-binding transcriptional regulator YiaG